MIRTLPRCYFLFESFFFLINFSRSCFLTVVVFLYVAAERRDIRHRFANFAEVGGTKTRPSPPDPASDTNRIPSRDERSALSPSHPFFFSFSRRRVSSPALRISPRLRLAWRPARSWVQRVQVPGGSLVVFSFFFLLRDE